ncbi:hypothetical protein HZH66_001391 [Vespula vulgaris]|uniref:Uncharacterized protein n=1 Tax=Vespula vulgaris TaxID=7454 RepID=A0A834KUF8_VESVU|nr:hypothetical protein HZH66_001391 [Vespula vulgaris]
MEKEKDEEEEEEEEEEGIGSRVILSHRFKRVQRRIEEASGSFSGSSTTPYEDVTLANDAILIAKPSSSTPTAASAAAAAAAPATAQCPYSSVCYVGARRNSWSIRNSWMALVGWLGFALVGLDVAPA